MTLSSQNTQAALKGTVELTKSEIDALCDRASSGTPRSVRTMQEVEEGDGELQVVPVSWSQY